MSGAVEQNGYAVIPGRALARARNPYPRYAPHNSRPWPWIPGSREERRATRNDPFGRNLSLEVQPDLPSWIVVCLSRIAPTDRDRKKLRKQPFACPTAC